jgi:hypothetical protein
MVPGDEARALVKERRMLDSAPVVVDLAKFGVLKVTGSLDGSRAWARSLMVQLAAVCAPQDLRMITCFEDAAKWAWGMHLPHQRWDPRVPEAGHTLAGSPDQITAVLTREVRPRMDWLRSLGGGALDARPAIEWAGPSLVAIIDAWSPERTIGHGPEFRELVTHARAIKAVVVLLVDGDKSPPFNVDASLSIRKHRQSLWQPSGPDAAPDRKVQVDKVDVPVATEIARMLEPLQFAPDPLAAAIERSH